MVAGDPAPAPPASIAPGPDPAARTAADGAAPPPPAPAGARWSVQMGAFAIPANAQALRERLALLLGAPEASVLPPELRTPRIERHGGLDRVLIGKASERAVGLRWSRLLERYLSLPSVLFAH